VIVDLKRKKLMDRPQRFCVGRFDANSSAVWDRFENISNIGTLGFHGWDPGRYSVMDEHRDLKIPVREYLSDVG